MQIPDWIPVERPPEKFGHYLVTIGHLGFPFDYKCRRKSKIMWRELLEDQTNRTRFMTPERKIKHLNKAWREYNIRRRAFQKPELSLEEYLNLKIPVDYQGKINPRIRDGEQHMISVFGIEITTKHKICLKCGKTKPYIDYICRYKSKRIENICKDCDQSRKRKKMKDCVDCAHKKWALNENDRKNPVMKCEIKNKEITVKDSVTTAEDCDSHKEEK